MKMLPLVILFGIFFTSWAGAHCGECGVEDTHTTSDPENCKDSETSECSSSQDEENQEETKKSEKKD